ncbi:hypothetical protein C5Y96_24925 [Blastopirellula marina]|uniref:DUF3500 domain-containing protein n=1 Tax=Blastopirellula marina TaxID=124 RepID=A0A2S8F0B0_9BACT|nr:MULTISPECIES: DUF3500 domain-containing protein [Pirellulaceae]PQO25579.1 hypothetical protein C5Y96_24925 [Blastopirellula marina]RCS42543.1 DUF3500 domain-containing protein [Bremerella cremea]
MIKIDMAWKMAALLFVYSWNSVAFGQADASNQVTTAEIATSAQAFLNTLDEAKRSKVIYKFSDDEQRKRWSNFPVGAFPRGGISMGELSQEQRSTAMEVLKAVLSEGGYQKVLQIVEADEVLKNNQGGGRGGPGGRGGRGGGPGFGRDNYFISFLGKPSATEPWMMQFGGHHLAINITFVGENGTLAPSHTAAQPAVYQIEGKTIKPLGKEVEKAEALMASLNAEQRTKAVLGYQVRNLVLGPGRDGQMIEPEGLKADQLSEKQRAMLIDLATEWTGIANELVAAAKLEEMKKGISETWFAWSGSTEKGSPAYFRIHGPTVFIEFAPQGQGESALNHIHTIYRDPTNEYGAKWWRK